MLPQKKYIFNSFAVYNRKTFFNLLFLRVYSVILFQEILSDIVMEYTLRSSYFLSPLSLMILFYEKYKETNRQILLKNVSIL